MVSNLGGSMNNAMGSLKHAVNAMLGLKNKHVDGKGEQLKYEDVGGNRIFFDLKARMETVAKADREVFLATRAVKGDGPAAGRVRELISAQIGEFPFNSDKVMGQRYTDVVRPLHSLAALSDAKKVAKGLLKDTGFAKAIADGTSRSRSRAASSFPPIRTKRSTSSRATSPAARTPHSRRSIRWPGARLPSSRAYSATRR